MSEWFIEYDEGNEVVFLELHEMIFEKINIPLHYTYGGSKFETSLSVDFWKPTGETTLIELDNPPLLIGAYPDFQLIRANKAGDTVPNESVLNDIYQESLGINRCEKVASDTYRIVISDYYKLANVHPHDGVPNTWLVFRDLPDFEKSIRYLISMEFVPNEM